jgi:hypothetical protein
MGPITVSGCVHGNTVVMDEDIGLPEGTPVTLRVETAPARLSLADRLRDVIGIASDLPPDMARNHDHYLHGASKK